MTIPVRARRLVAQFEGFRSEAYLCPAGVWTIGYGFTSGVKPGDVITREEADVRLEAELAHFAEGVRQMLTRPATPNQFGAMVSLAFNIGLGGPATKNRRASGFYASSVRRLHNAGDFEGAARAFALWNKAGGKVLPGLVRRRAAEADLYLTPEIPAQPLVRDRIDVPEAEIEPAALPMPQRVDVERPLTQSRIVQASSVSGGVAGLTLAAEGARAIGDIKYSLGDWLPYIALAVVVVAAGWAIYERVKQRREGVA